MRNSNLTLAFLATALVATNIAWVAKLTAANSTMEKAGYRFRVERAASLAARGLLPRVACQRNSKSEILTAALELDPSTSLKEETGAAWVGPLGFRFDGAGRLIEVQQASAGIVD